MIDREWVFRTLREEKVPFNAKINNILLSAPDVPVRCKNCVKFSTDKNYNNFDGECLWLGIFVNKDFYCADGVEKPEDKNAWGEERLCQMK